MSDNPYIYLGKPVRVFQHFYGRRRELAKVADDVRNKQCVSVVGVRRIGKTSLLFQLLDHEARSAYHLGDDRLCIYIDCGRLARISPGEVYAEIMRRVCRQFGKCRGVDRLEQPGETLSYRDFEDNILELHEAGLNLVLLLDEFERLADNPHLDVSFFLGLRALHIEHELTYVTASRQPIMELSFSHEEVVSSPFPNVFDSIRLGLFPEPEGRELTQAAGVFSAEVEDFLLDLTGGHPLALQYACHYAFERQPERPEAFSSDDRLAIWNQTQEAMTDHFRYYWKHLSHDQRRVLVTPDYFTAHAKDDIPVENLLKDLVALSLLVKRADGSFDYAGRALAEFVRWEASRDKPSKALAQEAAGRYQSPAEMLDTQATFIKPRQAWGVLVGINRYQDAAISALSVCANDVSLICDRLCATHGYQRARLRLLTDDREALPTKSEILASLQAVSQSAVEEDLLLFYFSGHGVVEGNESFLLPMDARYGVLADTSLSMQRVSDILLKSEARAKILILDACHSGAQIGKAPLTMSPQFMQRVFDEAEGMVVLASCTQGQVSWEWPERNCSVFTYYVLEGISGVADRDGKGFVTMNDLVRHVTDGVKLWAVRRGRVQTPTMQAQVAGDIILVDRRMI